MCTAITYTTKDHYFGRNLDLDYSHHEQIIMTPRNYEIQMRCEKTIKEHYAMIGIGTIQDNYPLYYEATNEKGLSMAGLNFPNQTTYSKIHPNQLNITPYELIPYLLGLCDTVIQVKEICMNMNLVDIAFNEQFKLTSLHWICSDSHQSITIEYTDKLTIYDNPVGVLTNNPFFDYHLMNLNNYMYLHEGTPINHLSSQLMLSPYSLGMGALGLPGDYSSTSRFIRAVFVKYKSVSSTDELDSVTQFFHILNSVSMPKGCVMTPEGNYEYTRYSSCCNVDKGIYYYTTYDNQTIRSISLYSYDLELDTLTGIDI